MQTSRLFTAHLVSSILAGMINSAACFANPTVAPVSLVTAFSISFVSSKSIHVDQKVMVVDGVATCIDSYSNCALDEPDNAALFPNGTGCEKPPAYLLEFALACAGTCPQFCGASSGAGIKAIMDGSPESTTTPVPQTVLNTTLADVQQNIVDLHNAKRRRIPTTGSVKMTWDPEVAALAQAWADQCIFDHPDTVTQTVYYKTSKWTQTGQNIAEGTANTWSDTIDLWYNEINHFVFGNGTTDPAQDVGHYTQLVWNSTHSVGCGYKLCPEWGLFVCNYGPAGNLHPNQNYPYQTGIACSACPDHCEDGLCTNPCSYENVYGNCEVDMYGDAAMFPNGCNDTDNNADKDSCKATCQCQPSGLIYRPY